MTKNKECRCCKTNSVGKSTVMCTNCWDWLTKKITMDDISMIIAMLNHRQPQNKHAKRNFNISSC